MLKRLIVRLPDIHQDLILKIDASTIAVGVVFKQYFDDTIFEAFGCVLKLIVNENKTKYIAY